MSQIPTTVYSRAVIPSNLKNKGTLRVFFGEKLQVDQPYQFTELEQRLIYAFDELFGDEERPGIPKRTSLGYHLSREGRNLVISMTTPQREMIASVVFSPEELRKPQRLQSFLSMGITAADKMASESAALSQKIQVRPQVRLKDHFEGIFDLTALLREGATTTNTLLSFSPQQLARSQRPIPEDVQILVEPVNRRINLFRSPVYQLRFNRDGIEHKYVFNEGELNLWLKDPYSRLALTGIAEHFSIRQSYMDEGIPKEGRLSDVLDTVKGHYYTDFSFSDDEMHDIFGQVFGLNDELRTIAYAFLLPIYHPEVVEEFDIAPINSIFIFGPSGTFKTNLFQKMANYLERHRENWGVSSDYKSYVRVGTNDMARVSRVDQAEELKKLVNEVIYPSVRQGPMILHFDDAENFFPKTADDEGTTEAIKRLSIFELIDRIIPNAETLQDAKNKYERLLTSPGKKPTDLDVIEAEEAYLNLLAAKRNLKVGITSNFPNVDSALLSPKRLGQIFMYFSPPSNVVKMSTDRANVPSWIQISHFLDRAMASISEAVTPPDPDKSLAARAQQARRTSFVTPENVLIDLGRAFNLTTDLKDLSDPKKKDSFLRQLEERLLDYYASSPDHEAFRTTVGEPLLSAHAQLEGQAVVSDLAPRQQAIVLGLKGWHDLTREQLNYVAAILGGHSVEEIVALGNLALLLAVTRPNGPKRVSMADFLSVYDKRYIIKTNNNKLQKQMERFQRRLTGEK